MIPCKIVYVQLRIFCDIIIVCLYLKYLYYRLLHLFLNCILYLYFTMYLDTFYDDNSDTEHKIVRLFDV